MCVSILPRDLAKRQHGSLEFHDLLDLQDYEPSFCFAQIRLDAIDYSETFPRQRWILSRVGRYKLSALAVL